MQNNPVTSRDNATVPAPHVRLLIVKARTKRALTIRQRARVRELGDQVQALCSLDMLPSHPRLFTHTNQAALMLTRAAPAVRPEAAHGALPPLPLPCVLDVLSRLDPGERLLASAVSRAWRAAVGQPLVYASVDLTLRASDALLRAVVRKAAGKIISLKLCLRYGEASTDAALAAVKANGRALRNLDLRSTPLQISGIISSCLSKDEIDGVLRAAPNLLSFDTDAQCYFQDAQTLLAGQGQYSVVHLRRLDVNYCSDEEVALLATKIRVQPSLEKLSIDHTPLDTPAAVGALVDAVVACGLTGFILCRPGPQSAMHLARLLRDTPRLSTLLLLSVVNLFASGSVLAAALRSSRLTVLHLHAVGLWVHEGVGNVVVDALVAHPTLQEISFAHNRINFEYPRSTVGACLARLAAANTPSLQKLSMADCGAGDDVLRAVFAALPSNTFLRTLNLTNAKLSAAFFARDVVLPSVRANFALHPQSSRHSSRGAQPCVRRLRLCVS